MNLMKLLCYYHIEDLGYIIKPRTNEELMKEAIEKIKEIRKKYSKHINDCSVYIWLKMYRYKGIPYHIGKLKYFNFKERNPLNSKLYNIYSSWFILSPIEDLWNINLFLSKGWLCDNTQNPDLSLMDENKQLILLHKRAVHDINFIHYVIFNYERINSNLNEDNFIRILTCILKSKYVDVNLKTKIIEYYKKNNKNLYLKLLR